jgi:hypothetical protein
MNDGPSTPTASTSAIVPVQRSLISKASDVDDAVLSELTETISKWSRIQIYGQGAIAIAATAILAWGPFSAILAGGVGIIPALILANHVTDRAILAEFVAIGFTPEFARRLLQKSYTVPGMYFLMPAVFSNSPHAKRRISAALNEALAKC